MRRVTALPLRHRTIGTHNRRIPAQDSHPYRLLDWGVQAWGHDYTCQSRDPTFPLGCLSSVGALYCSVSC